MLGAARWSLVPALVFGWLLLPASAHAIVPKVHDGGNFFNDDTVKRANDLLLKIQEKHKKDVVVETFGEIPKSVLDRIKYDPANRRSFFEQWAKDLAKENKVDGIVILIAKDQNHKNSTWIEEVVGENTRAKAFKSEDRSDLHNIFENKWGKDRNAALLDGLQFVDSRMAAHHKTAANPGSGAVAPPPAKTSPPRNTPQNSSDGGGILGYVCIGVAVLLGIWLIVGLFRAFSGGGGGGYAGGPGYAGGGYGGGGGGFMSGLMGGLFGAMAGNWLYNNMFGGQSYHQSSWGQSSAQAGGPADGNRDDFGPSDQGQGFAGGGGDVDGGGGGDVDSGDAGGGGGGGGDWAGGGDAGGGDWGGGGGGGDWGGGGDAGGGGGDFGGGGGGGDW